MYKEAHRLALEGKIVFIDRGLPGDLAFAYMQKDKGFFTEEEFETYLDLVSEGVSPPDMVIYLDCTAETAWKRVLSRGILAEKNGYNLPYLEDLHNFYEKSLKTCSHQLYRIDWNAEQKVQNDILDFEVCLPILRMCRLIM